MISLVLYIYNSTTLTVQRKNFSDRLSREKKLYRQLRVIKNVSIASKGKTKHKRINLFIE